MPGHAGAAWDHIWALWGREGGRHSPVLPSILRDRGAQPGQEFQVKHDKRFQICKTRAERRQRCLVLLLFPSRVWSWLRRVRFM